MAMGASATEAVSIVSHSTPHIEYRQLTAVDTSGCAASFSGEHTLGVHAAAIDNNVVCAGNLLSSDVVPMEMVRMFNSNPDQALADRLLWAMQAAVNAGGEAGPVHSSGLLLVDRVAWPVASLRVDWNDDARPIDELAELWQRYAPQLDDYVTRAINPTAAPAYGVAGESA
jgi:uncharacterized Ntn-hydrolase superfamily protein